jgi:PAS domain S-box-containing protein
LGGTALTTLVCALLLAVGGGRDRAVATAEQMTTDLRESERKARAVFDQTFQFIGLLDREGRIIEANQAALDFAGIRAEQVVGKYFPDTPWWSHSPEIRERVRQAIAAALQGEFVRFETTHPGVDGELHYVDFSLKPVVDDRGEVMWLLPEGRDISDIKRIQEAYKAAKEAAESASRFKSEFLANMSHEIRTPMTAILGYADLLPRMISGDSAEVLEFVNIIRRNGDHLMGLINDILDLSKIEAGHMTVERIDVDPRQILLSTQALMESRARERGIRLHAELVTDIPATIRSDPVKIKQILINLVANAVKFTEQGTVTIRLGYETDSPFGPAVTFAVADTGIGIPPEHMPRLFEAFQQADGSITRKFGGTGLGLRISQALAKLLGGGITVTSEPGRGSTFTAFIATVDTQDVPMIPRDSLRAPAERSPVAAERVGGARPLQGIRIFLAEDSPPIQKLISYHLSRSGAEVRVFANGLDALRALALHDHIDAGLAAPLPCDLLITDIQMPEMDGHTLARSLRAKGATLPIIGLTAHATPEDAAACIDAGCDRYATKPIDPVALITLCCQCVSGPSCVGLGARA